MARMMSELESDTLRKEVGAFEAETHVPKLLNGVAQGEPTTITCHENPVALLVLLESSPSLSPGEAVQRPKALRQGVRWGVDISLRDATEDGRG
jgi:antitoxin (DNA-binding transcriptional repressor) of toxin-antitoxin stability system